MALTKEEQEELKHIRKHAKALAYFRTRTKEELAIKVAELEMQIVDYFDNQSLKFEELKEGMWVWDTKFANEHNLYEPAMIYITKVEMCRWGYSICKYPTVEFKTIINPLYEFLTTIKFEPNRFYRREVKHDA